MPVDWFQLWLSLRVAGLAAAISLALGLWLAWLLAHRDFPGKDALGAAVSMLHALPPTVICTYLLFLFDGRPQAFTWRAAVLAAVAGSFPALARTSRATFEALDRACQNSARSLGASEWRVFWRIALPLGWRPILAAAAVAFARVLTEFAAVLIVARRAPVRSAPLAFPLLAILALVALSAAGAGQFLNLSRRSRT